MKAKLGKGIEGKPGKGKIDNDTGKEGSIKRF